MAKIRAPKTLAEDLDIQKAWDKTQSAILKLGFEYGVYCYISTDRSNAFKAIATENATQWLQHHLANNYSQHDPVVKSGQLKKISIWNSIPSNKEDLLAEKIMNERREYGMKSGITVPIFNKMDKLTAWLSLSSQASDQQINSIISAPDFTANILDIHVRTAAGTLSNLTGLDYHTCYAIVLSSYTNDITFISEKTGIMVGDLYRLFGYLFLDHKNIDFFSLDIKPETVQRVKILVAGLEGAVLKQQHFSKRQLDCLKTMMEGLTAKEAGKKLNLSPKTYEEYLANLRQRFNCSNQRELIFKLSTEKELLFHILGHRI